MLDLKIRDRDLMQILSLLYLETNSFLVAMAHFKVSGVVPAAQKPELNQGGLATVSQNSLPETCFGRVKILNIFDKLDNLMRSALNLKDILA